MMRTATKLSPLAIGCACLFLLVLPAGAQACRVSSQHRAVIHTALPSPLPANTIIARVEFESDDRAAFYRSGIRARIRRLVQGKYRGRWLIVRPIGWSSCSHPFENGKSGWIVAAARGKVSGILVVDPVEAMARDGYRLPDGWQLPPGYLEAVARVPVAAAQMP